MSTENYNDEEIEHLYRESFSYYRVLHHQSDYSLDENEPMIYIWQYPFKSKQNLLNEMLMDLRLPELKLLDLFFEMVDHQVREGIILW